MNIADLGLLIIVTQRYNYFMRKRKVVKRFIRNQGMAGFPCTLI